MATPTQKQLEARLHGISNHLNAYVQALGHMFAKPESFTKRSHTMQVVQLAIVDWFKRETDLPDAVIFCYLRVANKQIATFAAEFARFWLGGGDPPHELWIALHVKKYLSNNVSLDYYNTENGNVSIGLPTGLITSQVVDVTSLTYHLYASCAKENDEHIPDFPSA